MIASPGGHPKDVNLYQAQKALAHAALVTAPRRRHRCSRPRCPDGSGQPRPTRRGWPDPAMTSHAAVLERFAREGYRIGPHKAFQIARDASRFTVRWHTAMPPALAGAPAARSDPATSCRRRSTSAIARARAGLAHRRCLPRANATIPVLRVRAGA
ncbi:MAG: hypothetical protein M0C28_37305 [Candidatus Moduliflexus flocculans]|nr:hypothetical protein [Candidatus Moduliflexus flocculans]